MPPSCNRRITIVENAWIDALHQHGLNEPFLYAYLLRAADLAGEGDRGSLQRKIDAILC